MTFVFPRCWESPAAIISNSLRDVFPLHCLQEETESQHLIRIIWWREREELKGGTRLQQGRVLNAIMQSALVSLECTSISGMACLKHTHGPCWEAEAYAYFPRPLSRSCWDCITNLSIFIWHAFCNDTVMMLYYRSNICYCKANTHSYELLWEQHFQNTLNCQTGFIFKI